MSKDDDHMANPESTGGKISKGFDGMGAATPEDVRQRAKELAANDGISTPDGIEEYMEQAREEMTGENVPADDVLPEADDLDERDEVLGESGHHVPNMGLSDDIPPAQTLFNQGLEEAMDDEMRQGSKKLDREDRGVELPDDERD